MTTLMETSDAVVTLGQCRYCYKTTYPTETWRSMSIEQRQATGGREGQSKTLCKACSRGDAEKLHPEPGQIYEEPKCIDCGLDMPYPHHWRKAGEDERLEMLADGYVIPDHQDRERCKMCARARRRARQGKRRKW